MSAGAPACAPPPPASVAERGLSREAAGSRAPPRWLPAAALAVCLAALAVSAYLAVAHYTSEVKLVCSSQGVVDCARVTSSPQSRLAGVPLPVLGLAYFTLMLVADLPAAWRSPSRLLRGARLLGALGGVGFALYLVYVELFELDAVCIWCSAVHLLSFVLFALMALGSALTAGAAAPER